MSDPSDPYTISDDPGRLDLDVVHGYLATESYWAQGIPRETLERAVRHSLCFGVYHHGARGEVAQVGFARVVSDRATAAHLADGFILRAHRGRGLSKRRLGTIFAQPELQGLRHWSLATRDAHGLYRPFGFQALARPENRMERQGSRIHRRNGETQRPLPGHAARAARSIALQYQPGAINAPRFQVVAVNPEEKSAVITPISVEVLSVRIDL